MLPVVAPRTVSEVSDLVRQAQASNQALYPAGGRTMLALGFPPGRPGFVVDMRGLERVIEYPARDMTITVEAGITIARLQEILHQEAQRLPVDVPLPERATLGGALAVNASGPRRYGLGTFRDYVIGIHAMNNEGQEFKAGGRVVKNVAGYDLCKLLVGSMGTLGVVTQVTLKLKPWPEEQAFHILSCDDERLAGLLNQLHNSRPRPVCVDLLNGAAAARMHLPGDAAWCIAVGFEENRDAVSWQLHQLGTELAGGMQSHKNYLGNDATPVWRTLTDFPLLPECQLTFKANLLPDRVSVFCQYANCLPEAPLLQAHAGNGIVIGHIQAGLTSKRAREMLKGLHQQAAPGNVIVLRCPVEWKAELPIWGAPSGDASLMREIKKRFDPRHIFNPGRFLPEIERDLEDNEKKA